MGLGRSPPPTFLRPLSVRRDQTNSDRDGLIEDANLYANVKTVLNRFVS
jgi:hypothetical protein